MATLTDRIAVLITADGDQAVREFNKVAKSAGSAGRDVESRLTSGVNNALKKVGVQSEVSSTALATAGVAAAAAVAAGTVAFISSSVDEYVRLTDAVRNFSRTSGASAEESSKFVAVLDDLGISADTGAQAMFRLGKNAAVNDKALADVGVTVARNADGTANLTETLLNVADAYAKTPDPVRRTDIAFQAFGRSGAQLIPILEQGRKGLDTFFAGVKPGQIFSEDDLQKGMDLKLALDDLSDSIEELKTSAGRAAAGPLADFTAGLAALIDKARDLPSWLGKALRATAEGIPGVSGLLHGAEATTKLGHAQVVANRSTRDLTEAARQQAAEYQALQSDVSDAADAIFKLSNLQDRAAAAQDKINQLQSDIADLPAKHARDLADAQDQARSAAERLKDATEGLSDAQQKLRDINSGEAARKFAADIASANADLNEAKSKLQRAIDTGQSPNTIASLRADVGQAQVRVDETTGAKAKAVAQASDEITTAQKGVRDATRDAADAQAHLNDVRSQDISKEIAEKQRDLNSAIRDEAQLRGQIAEQSGGLLGKLQAEKQVFDQYGISVQELNDQLDRLAQWQADHPGTDTGGSRPLSDRAGFLGGQALTGTAPAPAPTPTTKGDIANQRDTGGTMLGSVAAAPSTQTVVNIGSINGPDPKAVVDKINENEYLVRLGRPH